MADLAEIMILEHLAVKRTGEMRTITSDFQLFLEFHRYLTECHVEIEEKILFPDVIEPQWEDSESFRKLVERTVSDHRLIEKLGSNLEKWHSSGNTELYETRMKSYFQVIEEHNGREEDGIFPRWSSLDSRITAGARRDAMDLIESFGRREYLLITGINENSFSYLFR